jgi:Holliday junction DNA helicase RuvA
LELKGKLQVAPVAMAKSPQAAPPPAPEGKAELLHSALTRLGFRPAEADRAVAALGERVQTEPLGDLVREALANLSKK